MFKICKFFLFALMSCLVCLPSVVAHEFIIKPVSMSVEPGATVPFSIVSGHVFMVSQEMEPADKVEASMIKDDTVTPIKLSSNPTLMTQDGVALCQKPGYSIITGHRKGVVYTKTTQGYTRGIRRAVKKG